MAEKETASYEAMAGLSHSQQHKPSATVLQLPPQMTSKPTKQQQEKGNGRANDSQGYYSNVSQKGKLILPTALWILLFIAGAGFLILLASLSRTIDTLDTLVELEQDKEARATVSEHLHSLHHQKEAANSERPMEKQRHEHEKAKQHQEKDLDFSDSSPPNDGWLSVIPHKSSWLSMPGWVSLEPPVNPPPRHREGPSRPLGSQRANPLGGLGLSPQIEGMVDNMMHQMMAAADSSSGPGEPEISGSIIISSTSDDPDSPPMGPPRGGAPSGLLSSIFNQVQPMLHSFGMMNRMRPDAPRPLQQESQEEEDDDDDDEKPLVSANIENLNINMGSEESDSNKREQSSLEKSIENLVGQLMDQRPSRVALGHEAMPELTIVNGQPMLSFGEDGPLDERRWGRRPEPHHNQAHHQRKRPSLSPLPDFLMGPSFSSSGPMRPNFNKLLNSAPVISLEALSDRPSEDSGPSPFDMLMPIGLAPNKNHHYNKQHQGASIESISQMFDDANRQDSNDDKPALFIRIADDNDTDTDDRQEQRARPSGERQRNRHSTSNTRRPMFGLSPYEQMPSLSSFLSSLTDFDQTKASIANKKSHNEQSIPTQKLSDAQEAKEEAKLEMLANDLADSILSSVLQPPANTPQPPKNSPPSPSPSSSVVMLNGKPLADGEGQKLLDSLFGSSEEPQTSGDRKDSASAPESEMLKMLFGGGGLPSGAFKVITDEPTSTKKQRNEEDKWTSDRSIFEKMLNELQDKITAESTASSDTAGGQADSSSTSTTKQTSDDPDASGSSPTSTKTTLADEEASQLMNALMDTMITLPQFSGDRLQASVGSPSSGGGAGSSSSGSSSSPVERGQITTATPLATTEPMTPASRSDSEPIVISSTLPNDSTFNSTRLEVEAQVDGGKSMSSTSTSANLPNDRMLSEFFGLKENEPLVVREEVTLPSTTSISTTTTTTTTQDTKQTRVEVTTGSPKFDTPTATSVASTIPTSSSRSTGQNSKAPPVATELIRQEDAPSNVPVLDLAPFAKSPTPFEGGGKAKKEVIGSTTEAPARDNKVAPMGGSTTTASAPQAPVATTEQVKNATATSSTTNVGLETTSKMTEKPAKSLMERADDFIERNLVNFRKLF